MESNRSVTLDERNAFTIPAMPEMLISDTIQKLNTISLKTNRDASNLHSAVMDVVSSWDEYQKRGATSRSSRENFIEARNDFHQALNDLAFDKETFRELMR
jgi:hypothetical protein